MESIIFKTKQRFSQWRSNLLCSRSSLPLTTPTWDAILTHQRSHVSLNLSPRTDSHTKQTKQTTLIIMPESWKHEISRQPIYSHIGVVLPSQTASASFLASHLFQTSKLCNLATVQLITPNAAIVLNKLAILPSAETHASKCRIPGVVSTTRALHISLESCPAHPRKRHDDLHRLFAVIHSHAYDDEDNSEGATLLLFGLLG